MARSIPFSWIVGPGETIPIDFVDTVVNTLLMTCGSPHSSAGPQAMVDQTPKYDNQVRKRKRRTNRNQVMGRGGLIRPDKRYKAKYI